MAKSRPNFPFENKKSQSLRWIDRFNKILESNLNNPNLTNQKIADELGISVRQLNRKLKQNTTKSPRQYISDYRLRKAKSFMEDGKFSTVKDTAKAVGYIKVGYFIKKYDNQYGKRPFQVLRDCGWR